MNRFCTFSFMCLTMLTVRTQAQDTTKTRTHKEYAEDENTDEAAQKPAHHKNMAASRPAFRIGIDGGLNTASFVIDGVASSSVSGGVIGMVTDWHLGRVVYIESGLYALQTGSNLQNISSGEQYTWRVYTCEVPVMLQLKFGKPYNPRFFVGFGGYAAYNITGTITPGDNGSTLPIGSSSSDYLKAFDMGLILDLGLQLRSGLFFKITSQGGLSDLQPNTFNSSIRTSAWGLHIGYIFGPAARKHYRKADDSYIERRM